MYDAFISALSAIKRTNAGDIEVKFQLTNHDVYAQAKHWCQNEFGHEAVISRPGCWWCTSDWGSWCFFYFKNETDAMAFKLRWC